MRILMCGLLAVAASVTGAAAQQTTTSSELDAVSTYLLEDEYPETFGDTAYRVKIENAEIADFDNDGRTDVTLLVTPHYRQSPLIVFFRLDKNMKVTRVREGLAPGDLQPLTGDQLDSHALGEAVDFDIGAEQSDTEKRLRMIEAAATSGGALVDYGTFFHMDGRKGKPVFIDMTRAGAMQNRKTCEGFRFSTVQEIAVGKVTGMGDGNVLAVWGETSVYLYRIKAVREDGLLDKQMWVVSQTNTFRGFRKNAAGILDFATRKGAIKPFVVTCKNMMCQQVD